MSEEKKAWEKRKEQLFLDKKNGYDVVDEGTVVAAADYCDAYKNFLNNAKTEREVAAESDCRWLKDAGYQQFDPKNDLTPPATRSISASWARPCCWLPPSATRSFEDGFQIWSSLTPTAPRLDLQPDPAVRVRPLQPTSRPTTTAASASISGVLCRWTIHGVFSRADGTTVSVNVGEDENDPVLLHHRPAAPSGR